ncbi:uncharacterized protein LOC106472351 [Limulus polyphemus]|uniref:Uncharacterized protein LOC106472351 n=1 Tax=Limulus polyphemus TaxID=6850 RepID=A0ABM1BTR0_LIMPO|nr:uncharacterized protein LOC106472351 [Limulus polyphemus]
MKTQVSILLLSFMLLLMVEALHKTHEDIVEIMCSKDTTNTEKEEIQKCIDDHLPRKISRKWKECTQSVVPDVADNEKALRKTLCNNPDIDSKVEECANKDNEWDNLTEEEKHGIDNMKKCFSDVLKDKKP